MNFRAPASIAFFSSGQQELPVGYQMVQPQASCAFCSPGEPVCSSPRGGALTHLPRTFQQHWQCGGCRRWPFAGKWPHCSKTSCYKNSWLEKNIRCPLKPSTLEAASKGSSRRVMDLPQFDAQLLQPRLRQELSEPWQCPDRFLPSLLHILQTAFCCIPVRTKGFATQFKAFPFRGLC